MKMHGKYGNLEIFSSDVAVLLQINLADGLRAMAGLSPRDARILASQLLIEVEAIEQKQREGGKR